ncbi:hypothetical protein HYU13_03810 [Candidatus Woesearchaeota archaeon]|nr:hypothetical protein [Candidatus Woesearchaeota archaeon]
MKGYHTLKEMTKDFGLYMAAKRTEPEREKGETVTEYLAGTINEKVRNATAGFKAMLKRNGYTWDDLKAIAVHDNLPRISSVEGFLDEMFGKGKLAKGKRYLKNSRVLRNGKLPKVEALIPLGFKTKNELLRFFRGNQFIPRSELDLLFSVTNSKEAKKWFMELIEEGKISGNYRGRMLR